MIFATVGTQLPFPRLIEALVARARRDAPQPAGMSPAELPAELPAEPPAEPGDNRRHNILGEEIVIQTGAEPLPAWSAPGLSLHRSLKPAEFDRHFRAARVVVGHAGIGTILSARRWGKPLVILPRRHALGEHRNDHQLATARQVEHLPGVHVAWTVEDLDRLLSATVLAQPAPLSEQSASHAALIARLRGFIEG